MTKEDIDLVRLALSVYHTRTVYPGCVEAFERIVQEKEMPTPMTIEMEADERQALDDFERGVKKVLWSRGSYEKFYIDDFFDDDTIKTIRAALQSPQVPVIKILETVLEQAEDEGLWFNAKYASEAYLQQELRRLHRSIELAALQSPRVPDSMFKKLGSLIKAVDGRTFENDPHDAIIDAAIRTLSSPRVPVIDEITEKIYDAVRLADKEYDGIHEGTIGTTRKEYTKKAIERAYAELQKGN